MSEKKLKPATKKPATRKPAPHAPELSKDDVYLFGIGMWERSWEKMGAHPDTQNRTRGWRFCVWAPDVKSVHVIGEFNDWDEQANPLVPVHTSAIWEGFIPGAEQGQLYKYLIETNEGEKLYKADPYAFKAECPPGTASVLWTLDGYQWNDAAWLRRRASHNHMSQPLNIYEVHIGSWKRHGDAPQGEPDEYGNYPGPMDPFPAQRGEFYTYDDLSVELVDYVRDMGYTHIEVMPLMEHPFDGSWGYQTTGYYAATSRYGNPQQLMHFIDACHEAGIGVIMDWVPGGFCADSHGLATFNGHMLFEHEIHPNWGTHKFDFARGEVRSFLVSNVLYWLENFHVDGIRMDGVSSMLYLNFGIDDPGQKKFNKYGTEEDLDASAFIRQVNCAVEAHYPDVMMMAEESTAWPMVTKPGYDGGLGFNFKWNMGWMNDMLCYCSADPFFRKDMHDKITFSFMYAFSENYILPLSHDEVVHGKCSLIGKMPPPYENQFGGLRALYGYMAAHPGKKMLFMGGEFAQFSEWAYQRGLDWMLLNYPAHRQMQAYVKALNHFYLETPQLWEQDTDWHGFEWISHEDNRNNIIAFRRIAKDGSDIVAVVNFSPEEQPEYRIGVPIMGTYEEIFTSDKSEFGGSGITNGKVKTDSKPLHGQEQSINIKIPRFGVLFFKGRPKAKRRTKAEIEAAKKLAEQEKQEKKPARRTAAKTKAAKTAVTKKAKAEVAVKAKAEVAVKAKADVAVKGETSVVKTGTKAVARTGPKEGAVKGEKAVAIKGEKAVAVKSETAVTTVKEDK